MSFLNSKAWHTGMKVCTVLFVFWIIGFFFTDTIQTKVLALSQHVGLPFVFGWIALANIIAGIPSSFIAMGMGVATAKGTYNPLLMVAVIQGASITGDVIAYALCRRYRKRFLQFLGVSEDDPGYKTAYEYVQKGGGTRIVFITRFFFAGILGFVNYAAGILQMPFKRFFLMAFCGELIWSVMWFYASFIPLNFRHALIEHWPITLAALACITVGLVAYQKRLKRKGSSLGKVLWRILIGN